MKFWRVTTLTRRLCQRAGGLRGGSRRSPSWPTRRTASCARSPQTKATLPSEIAQIQEFDIRTVIGDANAARRRKEGLAAPLRKALHRAACAVKSQSGKALLRKRGMHLERSFEHVLDEGGMRRATLQGTENLTKRHKIAAACFNLSLLMRPRWKLEPQNSGWQGPITCCLRLLSLTFSGQHGGFALFAPKRGISSSILLSFSESQPLRETTGFFNSLLGCGDICDIYFKNCLSSEILNMAACASLHEEKAHRKAQEYNIPKACSIDDLINDPQIDISLNLTVPEVHGKFNLAALEAGKHVYSEKPLAAIPEDGQSIIALAKSYNE